MLENLELEKITKILNQNFIEPIKIILFSQNNYISINFKLKRLFKITLNQKNKIEIITSLNVTQKELELKQIIIKILIQNNYKIKNTIQENKRINIIKDRIKIENQTNEIQINSQKIKRCEFTEYYFTQILNQNSKYYKRAILIYNNFNLIGIYKLKGNRLILSLKLNQNQIPLEKIGIYQCPVELEEKIEKFSKLNKIKNSIKKDFLKVNLIGNLKLINNKNKSEYLNNENNLNLLLNEKKDWFNEDETENQKFLNFLKNEDINKYFIENLNIIYNENKLNSKFDTTIEL